MGKCLYCYQETIDGDFHDKCSLEFFGSHTVPRLDYSLSDMHKLALEVIERSVSITGVQPKLSMSQVTDSTDMTKKRLTIVGALGGNYILKPPNKNYIEMPENEHLTMKMAKLFGIETVPNILIRLESGELAYLTRRIDRDNEEKIHMIDMFQITESFDKYRSSYEKIGKAIGEYTSNTLFDKLRLFELILFSFITGNNDMHLKNFSLINRNNGWDLSPAYDLLNVSIVIPDDIEELALTLGGEKRKITRIQFEKFADELQLSKKQIQNLFKRFKSLEEEALNLISNSFLSEPMQEKYRALLHERYSRLEL